MKEKIKGWWNENKLDVRDKAANVGGAILGFGAVFMVFSFGVGCGIASERQKINTAINLVCVRNPEIKTMIEKATEEVTEIIK